MSYFVRTKSKREILADHAGKDESFGNALAEYLNSMKAPVISVLYDAGEVTVVFHTPAKEK
jgi:hypothetical protein